MPVQIRCPDDLRRLLVQVQPLVAGGVLAAVPHPLSGCIPFPTVPLEGPWDDVLSYDFRCTTCGRAFVLGVDTYHGSGGDWTVMPLGGDA